MSSARLRCLTLIAVLGATIAGACQPTPSLVSPDAMSPFIKAESRINKPFSYAKTLVIVKYKAGTTAAKKKALRTQYKLTLHDDILGLNAESLRLPKGKTIDQAFIDTLEQNPIVQYAEFNAHLDYTNRYQDFPQNEHFNPPGNTRNPGIKVNDPMFARQWAIRRLNVPQAWQYTMGDPNIVVALMDTGVDGNHPDLQGQLVPGFNTVFEDAVTMDDSNHGTCSAGVIAAQANNGIGISGVAPKCKVMPMKIYWDKRSLKEGTDGRNDDDWKDGTWEESNTCTDAAEAFVWATDHGAKVICADFGYALKDQDAMRIMLDGVRYALDRDVSIVAAMHNYGNAGNPVHFPAGFAGVIGIGATDGYDVRFPWSGYGFHLSVMAPGSNTLATAMTVPSIFSPTTHMNYLMYGGTSGATPLVAGVVALIRSQYPNLKQAEVKKLLEASAFDLGEPSYDGYYGWGLVDAYEALRPRS